ncbi:MAG: DUF4263 domain-containing protein [Proteobacteria bacterium]|nr:DUF4263 domain-containing protein [Pseudomonadota bacterium]
MGREPWPENYIPPSTPAEADVARLESLLADARDEVPLQGVLADCPVLLRGLIPSSADAWYFPKPPLGNQFVPDFLLCHRNSLGFNWTLVELESPTAPILTRAGVIAAKLNDAQRQVRDWRIWLRDNIAYARGELGFAQIDAECPSVIIIGRRHAIGRGNVQRYRELSDSRDRVMTYDRFVEAALLPRVLQE